MSKTKKIAIVTFQTKLDGKIAETQIEIDPADLNSREKRKDAENKAKLAFSNLSKSWVNGQAIKVVDITTYDAEPEPEPAAETLTWSDVAFTCDYCGNKWKEKYPGSIVHKTLQGCRRCLIKLTGPGEQVRYTGGRDIRGEDRSTADKALSRGSCYVVAQAYKSNARAGIRLELQGIAGRFDFRLFVPAEFGREAI